MFKMLYKIGLGQGLHSVNQYDARKTFEIARIQYQGSFKNYVDKMR